MATLKRLNGLLTKASKSLDAAASEIRSLGLRPQKNIRKIADILVSIFEIQEQIYAKRPDLIPRFLKDTGYASRIRRAAPRGKSRRLRGA
jgi:hypothetical protein